MKKSIGILIAGTLISAALAVYGGIQGVEILLGAGVAAGFLCLLFIPVFYARAGKVKKIREKKDALIVFEYMRDEVEEIVREQRKAARSKSRLLAILLSVCIAVIFAPFCVIAALDGGDVIALVVIAVICTLMPWLSLVISPIAAESRTRRTACISVVGPDYILVTNQYIGVNDRYALRAVQAKFVPGQNGKMPQLHVLYRFKGGRTMREFDKWVRVPVPRGREEDAKRFQI